MRPVAKRREQHKCMHKLADGSVAFRLYHTDVVTWHPDNSCSVNLYDTQSTVGFADWFVPFGASTLIHLGHMYLALGSNHRDVGYFRSNKTIKLVPDDRGASYAIANKEDLIRDSVRHVDKEKSKAVREKLKPLLAWIKSVYAISQGDVTAVVTDEKGRPNTNYGAAKTVLEEMLKGEPTPIEDWRHIVGTQCRRRWRPTQALYLPANYAQAVVREAYLIAKPFKEIPVPLGELPKKSNW